MTSLTSDLSDPAPSPSGWQYSRLTDVLVERVAAQSEDALPSDSAPLVFSDGCRNEELSVRADHERELAETRDWRSVAPWFLYLFRVSLFYYFYLYDFTFLLPFYFGTFSLSLSALVLRVFLSLSKRTWQHVGMYAQLYIVHCTMYICLHITFANLLAPGAMLAMVIVYRKYAFKLCLNHGRFSFLSPR